MAEQKSKVKMDRLEDFIELAKSGRDIRAEVVLRRETLKQNVHPDETDDIREEKDVYLLMADFDFPGEMGGKEKVTKVYFLGDLNETEIEEKVNCGIANERLKMDYKRLEDAKINFEEKLF